MPQVIVTAGAVKGLERCRRFLAGKSPEAVQRAAAAIQQQLLLLETHPGIGRPVPALSPWRELPIDFGDSGYVLLYHFVAAEERVYVLAFRHQKEAGY